MRCQILRLNRIMAARLVVAIALGLGLVACATEPAPLNKTQPESVNKAMFRGDWYFKVTVTDTEWHNPYTFIGEEGFSLTGGGSKVRWEITQDKLNGYLVPQVYLDPAGQPVTNSIGPETLVLSFNIERHFDIRYLQNNTTREDLNVIVENTDKPWREREYMIVDWSQNHATNFWTPLGAQAAGGDLVREPVATWKNVEFFDTDNERVDTRAWTPDSDPDVYVANIDIQEQIHPTLHYWWQVYDGNSEPAKVRYRISLMKKNPYGRAPRAYQPLQYRDDFHRRFGFFRTEYTTYDEDRGVLESQKQYLINRFDTSCDVSPITGQWECKKVVFHASPSMPTQEEDPDLWAWTQEVITAWNEALQEATGREDDILEFRPNEPLLDDEGAPVLDDDGNPRYKYELGDIRYNFLNYVTKPGNFTPLGYGPSTADPDTGEIVNATVNVYGNWVDYVVTRAMDLYDVVAGNCSLEDVLAGQYYDEDAQACTGGGSGVVAKRAGQSVNLDFLTPALKTAYWPKSRVNRPTARIDPQQHASMKPLARELFLQRQQELKPADLGKFSIAANTGYESMLVPSASFSSTFPGATGVDQVMGDYSPSTRLSESRLNQLKQLMASRARHCRLEPDHYDNNILAFIEETAGLPRDEVKKALRRWVYYTTTLHEMGHTLGLRHNFRGSVDRENFPTEYHQEYDHYWQQINALQAQYRDGINGGDPIAYQSYVEAVHSIPSAHERYATSSIMDYNGDFEGWVQLPHYDKAAIAFGYGQKVEVQENNSWVFRDYMEGDFDIDPDNPYTADSAGSGRRVRYYMFCSDERTWDDAFCSRHDRGTTATEITRNFIRDEYKNYFFKNFKRDRAEFGTTSKYWRKWMRYYNYAKPFAQITVNNIWYGDFWNSLWTGLDRIYQGPESRTMVPGYRTNGGEDLMRASLMFYNYLLNDVLQRPDYGLYKLTRDSFGRQYWEATEEQYTQAGDLTATVEPGVGWGWSDRWDIQYQHDIYDDKLIRAGVELDKIIAMEVLSIPAALNDHLWHEKANGNTYWGDLWTGDGMALWKVARSLITDSYAHDQNPWCMSEEGVLSAMPTNLLEGVIHAGIITPVDATDISSGNGTRCPAGSYPVQPGMDDLFAIYPIFYGISGAQHPWYHNHLSDYMDSQVKGGNHRFDIPDGAEYAEFLNSSGTKIYQAVNTSNELSISYHLVDKARRISNRIRFMQACDEGNPLPAEPQKLVGTFGRTCGEVMEPGGCMDDTPPSWCDEEGWDAVAVELPSIAWRDVDRCEAMLIMMQDMIDLAGHYAWQTPGYLDEP